MPTLNGRTISLLAALAVGSVNPGQAQEALDTQGAPAVKAAPSKPASAAPKRRSGRQAAGATAEARDPQAKTSPGTKAPPLIASPPVAPQPVAPQSDREPTGEFQPVLQARAANVATCMDKIVAMSARVIDRPHSAVSTFVQAAPNDNVFEAVVGMNYPAKEMPNGVAIMLAAPVNGSKCQGQTVQIYPTTNACTAVQASLVATGRTVANLNSLPLLQAQDGNRDLLIPSAGGGCVVVRIGLQ